MSTGQRKGASLPVGWTFLSDQFRRTGMSVLQARATVGEYDA